MQSSPGPQGKKYLRENTEDRSQDSQGGRREENGGWGAEQWSLNSRGSQCPRTDVLSWPPGRPQRTGHRPYLGGK